MSGLVTIRAFREPDRFVVIIYCHSYRITSITLSLIYAHFSETVSGLVTIRAFREPDRFVVIIYCHSYRITSITLSLIYAHFSETVSGLVTIRAFRESDRFVVTHCMVSPVSRYPRYTPTSLRLCRASSPSGLSESQTGLLSSFIVTHIVSPASRYPRYTPTSPRLCRASSPSGLSESQTGLLSLIVVTLSPIYAHFSETVSGLVTIRAFRESERFVVAIWFHSLNEITSITLSQ